MGAHSISSARCCPIADDLQQTWWRALHTPLVSHKIAGLLSTGARLPLARQSGKLAATLRMNTTASN